MEQRPLGSRYRIGDLLGRGAMGQVYAGTDAQGNEFACKVLRSELTEDPDLVARFLQERSILVNLRNPNLVAVHDLVVEGETVAIVMDLVRGGDLRSYLTEAGTLLPAEVARIGAGIAAALTEVHRAGVLHLDVKPENVLLDASTAPRTPRLTDFGISRIASSTRSGRTSLIAGTPQYIAPELAADLTPTPATDLYALGIVLYELCCGVTPFAGGSTLSVMRRHADCEPGRPDGIPEPLWNLISWLLKKSPQSRPTSAAQVTTMLDALVTELANEPCALRLTEPPQPMAIDLIPNQQLTQNVPGWTGGPVGVPSPGVPVPKRRRRLVLLGSATILIVGTLVAVVAARSGASNKTVTSAPGNDQQQAVTAAALPANTIASTPPTTSAAMTVTPNLVGKSLAAAQDSVPNSVTLKTVDTIDSTHTDGTVLSQDPQPGAPMTGTIQVTVARAPVTVYVDTLRPVNGNWDESDVDQIAGQTFTNSLRANLDNCNQPQTVEYDVGKVYRQFTATAGFSDTAHDSSFQVEVQISADGRQIYDTRMSYGKQYPIAVDISGVLRVTINYQPIGGCDYGDELVLGQASLLGLPGEVPSSTYDPSTPTS